MRRVKITRVTERDDDLVLLGGVVLATDDPVTFHVRGRAGAAIVRAVDEGQTVEVELP